MSSHVGSAWLPGSAVSQSLRDSRAVSPFFQVDVVRFPSVIDFQNMMSTLMLRIVSIRIVFNHSTIFSEKGSVDQFPEPGERFPASGGNDKKPPRTLKDEVNVQ